MPISELPQAGTDGPSLYVVAADATFESAASDLAGRHGLATTSDWTVTGTAGTSPPPDSWLLWVDGTGVQLRPPGAHDEPGGRVNWRPRRSTRDLTRKQPLARACGKHETVWDATAGWGQDAYLLARLGYAVHAVERARAVAILLQEEVRSRESESSTVKLSVAAGDSRVLLRQLAPEERPDVIYVDPMFPPKRKRSALPKKEIQLLQRLVGADSDAADLVAIARQVARHRVIVKRPGYAPPLVDDPTVTYSGKLVRYDTYHTR